MSMRGFYFGDPRFPKAIEWPSKTHKILDEIVVGVIRAVAVIRWALNITTKIQHNGI